MSDTGQRLMRDVEELLMLLERAVDQKNKDEIFQRFIYHARLARRIISDDMTRTGKMTISSGRNRRVYLGGSKETRIRQNFKSASRKARSNVKTLYTVLQLLITSNSFRDILNDVQQLARHALAGQQQSTVVYPIITDVPYTAAPYSSQPQFSTLEDLKRRVAMTSDELERLKLRTESQQVPISQPMETLDSTNISGFNTESTLRPFSTQIPAVELDKAERLPIVTPSQPTPYVPPSEPLRTPKKQEPSLERVPSPISPGEEVKETKPTGKDRKDYVDSLIDDLRNIIIKINASPDFKIAFSELYKFITSMQRIPQSMEEPIVPRELRYEANFQQAQRDLLHILERFAINTSLKPTLHAFQTIREEGMRDYRLKDFIGDWSSYITRCVQDPAYIDDPEFRNRGRFLFERTREFHNEKYRPMFDDAFNSVKGFADGWSKDELTIQIGQCVNRIFRQDLMGQPDVSDSSTGFLVLNLLKPDLFNDFRNILLPNVLRQLHDVPLPRIEAIYGGNRLVLENLILPADAFLPMDFVMKAKSKLKLHPKSRIFGQQSSRLEEDKGWTNGLVMYISDIKTSVRDVKFTFDHPNTFPRIADAGLADIHIGGRHGLNITIQLVSDARDVTLNQEKRPKLFPHYVRVSIDNLKTHFHHSSHDTSYKLLSPVINYSLKKAIENAICDRIVGAIEFTDSAMARVFKKM